MRERAIFLLIAGGLICWLSICGRRTAGPVEEAELSGSICLAGSTSMERLSNALAEGFMEKYPGVRVTVECVGSGAGIAAVVSGSADIGNSSRSLKPEEKESGAVENIVALDGIAVCVDPGSRVQGLTRQELIEIYTGGITDWSQVGGEELPIVVIGHTAGSGTREAFEELLGINYACDYANELNSTGAVLARVSSTPGAIGYISMEAVDESVISLELDGVKPDPENVERDKYILSRPFVMVTAGRIEEQGELVRAWFAYVLGEEGRAVVEQMGLAVPEEPGDRETGGQGTKDQDLGGQERRG